MFVETEFETRIVPSKVTMPAPKLPRATEYSMFMNLYYGMNLTWPEWVERWRGEIMAHERAAAEHFRGRDADFLRFDVEADQLGDLISFIVADCLEPRSELPRVGVTKNRYSRR